MVGVDLQDEAGVGQIEIAGRRMECSYAATFYHDGRRRVYQAVTGTVMKTNKEWQEMERRFLNLPSRDGDAAQLHLADGKIAHGHFQIKNFSAGAPGRKVLRFALLTRGPNSQTA